MQDIKSFLTNLPNAPGVYQMLDKNKTVLYVGKAYDLKKRVGNYFNAQPKDIKTASLLKHIKDIDITVTNSETEAILLECNLIKKHQPRYNVLLRDDKSYPYIMITEDHPYPLIDFYRGPRKKSGLFFGPYPSAAAVRETIHLLQKLFQLRTCSNSFFNGRERPCLHYQIGRCAGPCVGLISAEDYKENVRHAILFLQGKSTEIISELERRMESAAQRLNFESAARIRDQILHLREIQERQYVMVGRGFADILGLATQSGVTCIQLLAIRDGGILGSRSYFPDVPQASSDDEILSAFITQHYLSDTKETLNIPREIVIGTELQDEAALVKTLSEQANRKVQLIYPKRGEQKKWLDMAENSAKKSLAAKLLNKINMEERMAALQQALNCSKPPKRIECFDISHSSGEATVASCVVFNAQGPMKNDYRRFNITDITPGDDVAAIRQVVSRRFKRLQKEQITLPDLVLIDGGVGQLSAANQALQELGITEIALVGIGKGVERKPGLETLYFPDLPPLNLPPDSLALHFIQQIRDEAHRFAITGHRARRAKTRLTSSLEFIPGIGSKRRQELLRYFGGIQALTRASLEELQKVPGINQSLAKRIFAALHDATL